MNTRWFGLGLLGALLLLAGTLPGGAEEPKGKEPPDPPDTPAEKRIVQVSQPIAREVTDHEDFTGRVEAVQRVELRARVTGYLDKINYKPGTMVKEGDVLFEIDPRPYQAQLDLALAEVALAEAHLKLATANVDRARKIKQTTPGAISQEEFDKFVSEKDEATAGVLAKKAACEVYKLNLEFTRIKAPISGKIGQPAFTAGNLITHDKTLLATLVSTDPVYVYFDVDERTYLRLARLKVQGKPNKVENDTEVPVQMGLADETGFPHQGKVDLVNSQVNPKTGTVSWRAVFANADGLFMPGMFARVRLTTSAPHKALLVPESAVQADRDGIGQQYLLIVTEKNVVERRNVIAGGRHGELRVIPEFLKADEWVVVKVPKGLTPGDSVKPEKVEKPKNDK